MGTFGITSARQQLGFTPSVSSPMQVDVRGTGGTGAAIGQALLGSVKLYQQYKEIKDEAEYGESQTMANAEFSNLEARLKGELDSDKFKQEYASSFKKIQSFAPDNKRYQSWVNAKDVEWGDKVDVSMLARATDNRKATLATKIAAIKKDGSQESFDELTSMVDSIQAGETPMDKTAVFSILEQGVNAHKDGVESNIRDRANTNPEETIAMLSAELKERNTLPKELISDDKIGELIGEAGTAINRRDIITKQQYKQGEIELQKQFIDGNLTKGMNDEKFKNNEIDVNTHRAYDTIIKNKELMDTDSILSEKWLNGNLTKEDIKTAQKEGRLNNSNVVASWVSKLSTGQFQANVYDDALARIRLVQSDKGKYESTRQWLLSQSDSLGPKWDDVRNRLETAMNASGGSAGPHVARAHKYINDFAKNNPIINDGTLDSIDKMQQLHDAIDANPESTPEQMRNLTQGLLLPYEEDVARGWFKEYVTRLSPPTYYYLKYRDKQAKEARLLSGRLLVQPQSKQDFLNQVKKFKADYGDDSKEAKLFFNKYIDSYEWENK